MKTVSVIGVGRLGKEISEVLDNYYKVTSIDKGFPTGEHGGVDYSNIGDISFIVVPTPSLPDYKFTSDIVEDVLRKIWKKNHNVVIVSTLMPGETDRLQKEFPKLNLVYNPTFVAQGSVSHDFMYPDFVLIGSNKNVDFLKDIYKKICKATPKFSVMSPIEAEIAKLSLNCYVTTKITFANQIGNICYRLGIKSDKILEAIGQDKRIGKKYFKAGLGYGGPCFPRDNLAMSAFMLENGLDPALTRTVHLLNERQIQEIVDRIKNSGKKNIGFSGLSYKEGTDIEEKSQLKEIYEILQKQGYIVKIGKGDINLSWNGIE